MWPLGEIIKIQISQPKNLFAKAEEKEKQFYCCIKIKLETRMHWALQATCWRDWRDRKKSHCSLQSGRYTHYTPVLKIKDNVLTHSSYYTFLVLGVAIVLAFLPLSKGKIAFSYLCDWGWFYTWEPGAKVRHLVRVLPFLRLGSRRPVLLDAIKEIAPRSLRKTSWVVN